MGKGRLVVERQIGCAVGRIVGRAVLALSVCLAAAGTLTGCGHGQQAEEAGGASEEAVFEVPPYAGDPFVLLNGNVPFFSEEDAEETEAEMFPESAAGKSSEAAGRSSGLSETSSGPAETPSRPVETCIIYSELDELGRCGVVWARLSAEMLPEEPRDAIGNLKPTGWHTVKYNDLIADNYLYNRCHLVGYQLGGANADLRNLMTGTRYLNVEGMLPFENRVAQYLKQSENHVLYRVTPVFAGENLLADGVIMEAKSMEDDGAGICFCVFAYNVQPGIRIDYATGDSEPAGVAETVVREVTYILNKSSGKFHLPACESVSEMAEWNRQESHMSREELISAGFTPCKICNP